MATPLAFLLGLHGLALMVVFPLGPQEARLWHPGVSGIAALVAAFPLAAVAGGLAGRRVPRLPSCPRTLTLLAFLSLVPTLLSTGYTSFFFARSLAGFVTGLSFVALHRILPLAAGALVARISARTVAFGMPLCLLAATTFDWRAAFVPILGGLAALFFVTKRSPERETPRLAPTLREAAPLALLATTAMAFVSGSLLTVLSGFLVFNAGHTEWHIPACLAVGAVLGLAVPPLLARLRTRLDARSVYIAALCFAAMVLCGLLALQRPVSGTLTVALIGLFLAANSARHIALAGLVMPGLSTAEIPAHQIHTHLAHHLGSGLGALCAGLLISVTPRHDLAGLPALIACALLATVTAAAAGLAAIQTSASPAASAAAANSR